MTALADAPASQRARLRPGSAGFMFTLAMCMAVTALGVDSLLPAFPDIRRSMGLDDGAVEVTRLISYYLLGGSLGLLPAGLLADRFGRRPVMWGGLALYIVGALGAAMAPSLGMMFIARFVWGLGSAGPRVAAMAMVRDSYEGDQMARQMSFIMAVFILVPMLAPSMSAGLLGFGSWQLVLIVCAGCAAAVAVAVTRLGESLRPADRRPLAVADVVHSCRSVLATPGTAMYLVSLTAMFSVFISFLASSEVVLDQVFGLERWFPLYFGGLSAVMGLGMIANGRIVGRFGLDRMIGRVFVGSGVCVTALLLLAVATEGRPPFWMFVPIFGAVLFAHQMLIPNLNAAAMRPLSHVAGTGAAMLGMVPGALGSVIGGLIDDRFDGSITPQALAFAGATAVASLAWRRAAAQAPAAAPAGSPA